MSGADDPPPAVASPRLSPRSLRGLALSAVLLSACTLPGPAPGYRHLEPPLGSRLAHQRQPDFGAAELELRSEMAPGHWLQSHAEIAFAATSRTELAFAFPLVRWDDTEGRSWDSSWTGDLLVTWRQDLWPAGAEPGVPSLRPGLATELSYVDAHGGARPARVPGLVENESGAILRVAADWPFGGFRGREACLHLNAGGALLGRPGGSGDSGRLLAALGVTQALAQPGLGYATQPLLLGLETSWVHDPVDERCFGELGLGLELPVGVASWGFGVRAGLTDETEDVLLYVYYANRLFDALW